MNNTSTKRGSKFPRRLILSLLFSTILLSLLTWLAYAEGSRSLYPDGIAGNRANLEWRNSFYGDNFLRRRTLLQLYLEPNEVALMGSSAIGVGDGDILVYRSDQVTGDIGDEQFNGAPIFTCSGQRELLFPGDPSTPLGRITSRDQELAGPDTINPADGTPTNGVPGGYVPCFFSPQLVDPTITDPDIYRIVFYGPAGGDSDTEIIPTGDIDIGTVDPGSRNWNEDQATSVTAWDVTVRTDINDPNTEITGRLFANYLALFTGGNPQPMFSPLYILTTDGFIYRIDMRGLDPFGFIVYANDVGFLDSDGQTPLYHDVLADRNGTTIQEQNQLNVLVGDTQLSDPTHLIFFNEPAQETIEAVDFPTDPIYPEISAVTFVGDLTGNSPDTFVGAGGTFTFNSTLRTGIYEIIISGDGSSFDPSLQQNRVLRGRFSNGLPGDEITVPWDGRANNGDAFPAGTYQARFSVHAGEYHFPLLDVENSQGGPQYELINPPNDECPRFDGGDPNCFVAFFDDRGYITAGGTQVGDPGQALPFGTDNAPNPPASNLLSGFDTQGDNRAFGDGTNSGFGDKKGLDLWTYFPSEALLTPLNIFGPDLAIQKTDHNISTAPGGVITYTLAYTNISTFPITATGVVITETVPANTIFNAGASTAGWSCADGSPAGTACVFSVGELPANDSGTVTFAVTVDDPLDPAVTEIPNAAIISDDRSQGDDPTPDNNTTEERTPVNHPLSGPDLQISKTDDGITSGPGGLIVYTLTYTNIGPVQATGVVITETVPANAIFNAGASEPGWSCADSSPAGTPCTLSLAAPLPVGGNGSVSFAVRVDNPLDPAVTEILNATSISDDQSQGPDPTPSNNTSQERTPVVSQLGPDLQISKTDGEITSGPGGLIVYTLTYTNIGPVQATGVVITETVPANAIFNAGASEPGWSCADSSPAGTPCTLSLAAPLPVGGNGSVSFAVRVDNPLDPAVTEILNATSISDDHSQGPDPTPSNNTSQERTPVNRIVTPVLSKVSDRSQAMPGDVVNFTITASLATPPSNINASNVIIVDALPKELELVNYSVSSLLPGLGYTSDVTTATISTAGHPSGIQQTTVATITVNVPVFSIDDRVTILVQARVNGLASPAPFNITNLAVLDYDEGDPRTSSVVVNVPPASSNPPKGGGGGGGDDDDDDDDTPSSPTTSASAAPAPAPAAQPTPGLPVLFLPETGQKGVTPAAKTNGVGFGVIWLVVLGGGIAGYVWWQTGRTRRKS